MSTSAQSTLAPIDAEALREAEFPAVGSTPFLNAASLGPLPQRSLRAVDAFNRRRAAGHALTGDDFEPTLVRARRAAARLVGAHEDEIALLPNTSFGVNLAAHALPLERGKRIVVSEMEFPANVYPWLHLQRTRGMRVGLVPADPLGRPDEARLLEALEGGDVAALALSAVQFATGYSADLARFGRACREAGAFFVVDAIQALGQVPVDVREAEVDVLVAGGQKWLCSPFGTGFAYVRRDLVARMEPEVVGWTSMAGVPPDFTEVCDYRYELVETARRFEVATQPWQDYAGFAPSVELLLETGIDRIRAHVLGLLDPLVEFLEARDGFEVVSDLAPGRRSGVFAFRSRDSGAAFRALKRAGVVCTLREGSVRVSPHLYNTPADVAAVIDVLARGEGW
ncbi:MAG TPA: aminotransferase class V-fold PLP-dependent enzyme [Longimicrobium sp.]|nr:aminotransferase class V-fold PLP-dependent enzyme [Longimicrobium sp.]